MRYPSYLLLLLGFILSPFLANAQLTVDVGPDLVIDCNVTAVTIDPTVQNATNPMFTWIGPNGFTSNQAPITVSEPGTYTLTVDDNGEMASDEVVITLDIAAPSFIPFVANATCNQGGSISLSNTGNNEYLWSNGSTAQEIINLQAGTYCVTVTGTNGCISTDCFTILSAPQILATWLITPPSCPGVADGSIDLVVTGGVPPYTYSWQLANGQTETTEDLFGLEAGLYIVTITDAEGCVEILTIDLPSPNPIFIPQINTCDGNLIIQPVGGIPPFAYSWSGPNGFSSTDQSPQNVDPGIYSVTVTDANGCMQEANITVAPNTNSCTFIYGRIVFDDNTDCLADAAEDGLANIVIKAEDGSNTFFGMSDSTGAYRIYVEPGSYVITPIFSDPLAVICPINPIADVPNVGDSTEVDFAISGFDPECPLLQVNLGASFLRRCFDNNYYWVQYSNLHPGEATDSYIDVMLDPFLIYVSSAIPAQDLGSNTYRFDLGTVEGNSSGSFWIRVKVDCDATLGQTHCSEAHIYPDTLCAPSNPLWSGAELKLRSECAGDSLHFILKNIGTAPMTNNLEYIVIEDGLMYNQGNTAPLAAGDSMLISLPATGVTWRVEANQEPYLPTLSLPVLSVEGCTTNGTFNTGFVNQFTLNDLNQFVDIHCLPNVASYDPNDKMGIPLGYGVNHYIEPGTPIEYTIRFQNTGTDTAFNVVILDTLSQWFAPESIELGASSHPYRFTLKGNGILDFAFDNIMLPDSNVNEPLSHGFVSFKINQRADIPLETDLYNSAAIYFDFNEPVITNETHHRVGENFLTVGTYTSQYNYGVQIRPNPMEQQSILEIVGAPADKTYTLRIYNVLGKQVRLQNNAGNTFAIQRGELTAGQYIFQIEELGISGKLIVQ